MKIAFRVDASNHIGSGHLVRCKTLAEALRSRGHIVHFVCRQHPGNLIAQLMRDGFSVDKLPARMDKSYEIVEKSNWLGALQSEDAQDTTKCMKDFGPDWLVVDHYGIDYEWEQTLRPYARKIFVIDDLADRRHYCDVLLDQNMVEGRATSYASKLPTSSQLLLGPQYAIVRPDFLNLRQFSLSRRRHPQMGRLLVFMGGSDPENETSKVVVGLQRLPRPWTQIEVVVGESFPYIDELKQNLTRTPHAQLHIQTPNMATLMASADLAITAGGTVTWEKAVLGLPSIVATTGENQVAGAAALHRVGAQTTLGPSNLLTPEDYANALSKTDLTALERMSNEVSHICDGKGEQRIISIMESY